MNVRIVYLDNQLVFHILFGAGGVAQQAPVSDPAAPRDGAADAAGPDERGHGGDGWAAHPGPAAQR